MTSSPTQRAAQPRWPGAIAAAAGASAVILGALGAHGLQGQLSAQMLEVWHTAVRFQFWHALALAICALLRRSHAIDLAAILFTVGMLLLCGSLYALALDAPSAVGVLTPLGGLAFIVGWISLGVGFYHRSE
ncbi:MAG TPA: DUF423 domain-containing protein [Rhodanobacteraceae bacterium]|nr:DUF423 domain-containing protein [Rhodanobacteraceae bacterium]